MQIAKLFSEIFHGNMNAHGVYNVDSKEGAKLVGKAATVRRPVTEELWQRHLDGKQGIGIIPINEESKCKFGAIDIDVYPVDYEAIAAKVRELKLPLIPCKSKSGGIHLYLFMKELTSASIVQGKLKEFAIKLGYGECEIFPKQTHILAERGDIGGWINMPYFNIAGPSDRHGVYPDGTTMSVEEFIKEVEEVTVSSDQLIGFALDLINEMVDGPPCLQYLITKKVSSGSRNIVLSNLCTYLKKADIETVVPRAHQFNQLYFDPPISDSEVQSTASSALKRSYDYSCTKSPLKQHCNKELCMTRKFGINKLSMEGFQLENLTKFNSDPPIWFVNIQGLNVRLELATEDLQNQVRFQTKCLNAANIYPPKMSNNQWLGMIQTLLQKVHIVEAPKDTSPKGQFYELLEKFCTNRVQAKSRDELLLGKPWTDDGFHHFRISDVMTYLDRNHFKELKLNQVASLLRDKGGDAGFVNVKGKGITYWKIPEFPKQTEGYEITNINKEQVL